MTTISRHCGAYERAIAAEPRNDGREDRGLEIGSHTPSFVQDILWSIPEQKTGTLQLLGGNLHSFLTEIRTAEGLKPLPLKEVRLALPDSLKKQLPSAPELTFLKSTPSGSFDKSHELDACLDSADFNLVLGDLSKNSATEIAITNALKKTQKPTLITRDAVDLVTTEISELLEHENFIFFATLPQLQKLFRACLYPKMILLSMPLNPILDTLHKFTLSYPATIITQLSGQLIFAHNGTTKTLPLEKTTYTMLSLWTGTLAGKIAALNLWTPGKPLDASIAAFFYNEREQ